jgi:hypothetical protein
LGGAGSHRDQAGPTLAEQLEEFGVSDELRALVAELEVGAAETAAAAAAAAELVAALKDAQLRLTADFENFRKRTVREPSLPPARMREREREGKWAALRVASDQRRVLARPLTLAFSGGEAE